MLGEIAVSIGGIAFIVALAWLLGRGRTSPRLGVVDAAAIADEALAGFESESVVISADGRSAAVLGRDGRTALLKPHGDHWSVRLAAPGTKASVDGGDLIVRLPEAMFGEVRIAVGEPQARSLAARLEGQ